MASKFSSPPVDAAGAAGILQRLSYEVVQSLRAITTLAVIFVGVLIAASLWVSAKDEQADAAVARTVRNERLLAVVQSLLQDAEIGQRGYLLTGDETYLEPYKNASAAITGALDELAAGVAENRRQNGDMAVLHSLATQKLSELRLSVQRRHDGNQAGALAVLQTSQGKVLMDGVRDVLARMNAEEDNQMAIRTSQAHKAALRMEIMVVGLAMMTAIMGIISARSMLKRARSAEASRDELLARLDRKLLAIMAADLVGYSRMMEADEARTLLRLKRLRGHIDPIILQHSGTIVTTAGDSVVAAFPSALSAVDCALKIQTFIADESDGQSQADRLLFRIGINVGDVIVQDGDVFGDTVNIAARLEPLAEPGGICISRAVRDHVRKQRSLMFDDLGLQTVKNIAHPVSAFRISLNRSGEAES